MAEQLTPKRYPIRCDCCGEEIMAERVDDRIVIRIKRHGKEHCAVVPFENTSRQAKIELET